MAPGTASEPAGSPLGDALNAVAAAVDCARLAMAGHGHRPIAAALGVPAGTVRGWLRRLRARAGQLRAHAIGELRRAPPCAGPGSRRTSQRPLVCAVQARIGRSRGRPRPAAAPMTSMPSARRGAH